jgi:hypothetical protein
MAVRAIYGVSSLGLRGNPSVSLPGSVQYPTSHRVTASGRRRMQNGPGATPAPVPGLLGGGRGVYASPSAESDSRPPEPAARGGHRCLPAAHDPLAARSTDGVATQP